ncbi:MAG: ABC transporter permease, partial [Gemmatimonadota bacterium]
LASRAHGAIRGLGQDAVHGVLLFLLLSLPGAVLAERLLLAAPGVRGQVAGAASIYLVLFGALRVSHPAFEMSLYPLMILVAFLVLALSLAVTAIGLRQLNRQLHHSLSSAVALHRPDTRRAGMAARALLLGVAQMRRRPLRTGLTCATLVLVTFSLASFTSVRTALRTNRVALGPPDPGLGDGLLVRLPAWQGLEGSAGPALARRLGEDQVVARWWYLREAAIERDGRTAAVKALLGLEAREPEHSRVDRALVAGRWLNPGETGACLLPEGRARELGIGPGEVGVAQVRILGAPYRVVGLLDAARLDAVRDLGGAPLTPLDVDAQQPDEPRLGWARAGGLAAFSHLPAAQLAVLPAAAVARWGEWARLAAVSVRLPPGGGETTVNELAEELGLNLFASLDGQRYLVNTVGVQVFAGRGELWVPLVIAGLIVLNTMLGSVYERLPEIATLNAVGLAPVHVSGLFLAEAAAYAVLSGVAGYLLGQGVARVGLVYGLFPGLTVNYSSLSTAATVAGVMAVVVASAAYPARLAARVCVPGVERAWRLPRPQGDALDLPMPFSLGPAEARGLLAFLAEYLELYGEQSIGAPFCAEGVRAALGTCSARVWLAPYDQGISQRVTVAAAPEAGGRFWAVAVHLERASGPAAGWLRANRLFVDGLRRQFLAWRALSPEQRAAYLAAAPTGPLEGAG